jgi:thiol-disulfide isomerase/thioredoxin
LKARKPGLPFLILPALFIIGTLASIFLHQQRPVNYAQNLDALKIRGAPDFRLPLLTLYPPIHITDETLALPDLKATVTIVNFWASWCAPCIKELPSLSELAKKYSGDSRLSIIGISEDRDTHQLIAFLEKSQNILGTSDQNFKFLWDGNFDVANRFGSQKIPETYILDKDHKLIRKVIDEQNWMSHDFLKWLDGILESSKS